MTELLQTVKEIISNNTDLQTIDLSEDKNLVTDLEIDSLDILDIVYEVDQTLNVQIPLEDWIGELTQIQRLSNDSCSRIS